MMRVHPMDVVEVDIEEVSQHPENPHSGDVDAIAASMQANGIYRPILVQRSTGYIVAGNHTYLAAMSLGMLQIPAIYLDLTDDQARRLMIADNRTSRLGHDDESQLAQLLADVYATDEGLYGTGYDFDDYSRLMEAEEEPLVFDEDEGHDHISPEKPPKMGFRVSLFPVRDEDGQVYEVTVTRAEMGPLSKADFQRMRKAFGLERATKEEIDSYEIPGW